MKKQINTCEGPCGITVELSIIDQYKLTEEIAIIDLAEAEMKASADWEKERIKIGDGQKISWSEREQLRKEYDETHPAPKPTVTPDRLMLARQNILKLVRKFALESERRSNIFDD